MARAKSIDDQLLLRRLTEVFQTYGYEGASLGRISEVTGLQRASLYHRFPGGKLAMAEAVLDRAAEHVVHEVVAPLKAPGAPRQRIAEMAREVDRFYTGGKMSCLLDAMSFGGAEESLRRRVETAMLTWKNAIAEIAREVGLSEQQADERAVDAMIRIQGSLVFARATGDTQPFHRTLETLPDLVLDSESIAG